MKKLFLSLALCLSWALASHASPIILNLTAFQQDRQYAPSGGSTNKTAGTTNSTSIYTSTIKSFGVNPAFLIRLLTNAFKTNLPAGAKLVFNDSYFQITDATGAKVLLDVSSVLSISSASDYKNSATIVNHTTTTKSGSKSSYSNSGRSKAFVIIIYDDTAKLESLSSSFSISGFATEVDSYQSPPGSYNSSLQMLHAAGSGTIRGVNTVLEGMFSASGKEISD